MSSKGGIKLLDKSRGRELKKQRIGQLNAMKLKQSYLTSQVSNGDMTLLIELTDFNIRISLWYEAKSDAIVLLSRSQDIHLGEKVRIYYHGLHKSFQKS